MVVPQPNHFTDSVEEVDGLVQQRAAHKQLALPTMTFTPNVSPPPPECNVGVGLLVEEKNC